MSITKVYTGKKISIIKTIAINFPSPALHYKYRKEDKERAKNAKKNSRLVNFITNN